MNLREIVNRPDKEVFEQDEMLFVIEEYIYAKKGIRIKAMIRTDMFNSLEDLDKMIKFFNVAKGYYSNNND